jgi:hypothetical protein
MRLSTGSAAIVALAFLSTLGATDARAQGKPQSPFDDSLNTVAGELRIVELERNCRYEVTLRGKRLLATDCGNDKDENAAAPIPQILVYSKIPLKPFSQVVVVQQQMTGNACDGGPLWLLGLKADGSSSLSSRIDFCGGAQPSITVEPHRIVIAIPGGPRNRGKGSVPPERWAYQNGEVKRLKRLRNALRPTR